MLFMFYAAFSRIEWLVTAWRTYISLAIGCFVWLLCQGYCPIDRIYFHAIQFRTGRPLDVAFEGRGFLVTQNAVSGETKYFRSGRLRINECGQLVIKDQLQDYLIYPEISIPCEYKNIVIEDDGRVFYGIEGQDTMIIVGQLQAAALLGEDDPDVYLESPAHFKGVPACENPGIDGLGRLLTGHLELSFSDWFPRVRREQ